MKGEFLSVTIDETLVQQGVSQLQHTLIGKLSLAPRDSPYSMEDLTKKLQQVWGITGSWQLIPLSKSYFNV